ncbi:uncharacterized protein LOC142317910 [Lycorma delicatula]|uniref:uncharacterized protein LOC142317910 n=1 Tax=Lycorma delicatula TaxID=130591 RepID=UPI003F50E4CC
MAIDLTVFLLFSIQMVQMKSVDRICIDFTGIITVLYGLFIAMYVAKITKPFKEILKFFDDITSTCLTDPLDHECTFHKRMLSDYKFLKIYNLVSVSIVAVSAVEFFSLNVFRSLGVFRMDGKKVISVDIWIPDIDKSPNFEISQLLGMLGIFFAATQKQVMEGFIISLLALLCSYFDHLNMTADKIFNFDNSSIKIHLQREFLKNHTVTTNEKLNLITEHNLKSWIKIHQNVLRLCRELTDLLSPMLAFYLVNITSLVAVAVISVTLTNLPPAELISLSSYATFCGITLYLMCHYGSCILEKSDKTAQPIFWKCFQEDGRVSKNVYQSLRIVFQRTLRPLVVSPFRSTNFELSKVSFVSIIGSIISVYFALKKIKEITAE